MLITAFPTSAIPCHRLRRVCVRRKEIHISTVLARQTLGIKEVDDDIWLVSFMDDDLGYIELEQRTLQPLGDLFGPKVVTYVPGTRP